MVKTGGWLCAEMLEILVFGSGMMVLFFLTQTSGQQENLAIMEITNTVASSVMILDFGTMCIAKAWLMWLAKKVVFSSEPSCLKAD